MGLAVEERRQGTGQAQDEEVSRKARARHSSGEEAEEMIRTTIVMLRMIRDVVLAVRACEDTDLNAYQRRYFQATMAACFARRACEELGLVREERQGLN